MKRILKITTLALSVMLFTTVKNPASAQVSASITFQTFYDELSPYGRWIDYPRYGYVWCPVVDDGFRPYSTMGHWEYSDDYEWIWVSDYPWGWAPFHYGRWVYDPIYGWLWVPGYEWAPAWVAWRSGDDYCGWAPLEPGFDIGVSFGFYSPPVNYWCFVPRTYILSPRVYDYCYAPSRNVTIINHTTIINNYNYYGRGGRNVFVTGPRRNEVEGWTHERIRPVAFRDSQRPGAAEVRNHEIRMYRPSVQQNNNGRYSPRDVVRYNPRENNNGFNRNNNGFNRNDNAFNRGNNLPQRNERNFSPNRQENNNAGNERNNRNVFDRRNDNNLPNRNEQRVNPFERRNQPVQNENRNYNPRNFGNPNNNQPSNNERRMNPFERRQPPVQNENRNTNPRNFGNPNNNQPRQQYQPRQFEQQRNQGNQGERRNDNNGRGRRRDGN